MRQEILFSVQRALLEEISPALRQVACEWREKQIRLCFVFDGEIADQEIEACKFVSAEVIAEFPEPWTISEEVVRLDYPNSLAMKEGQTALAIAYRRREQQIGSQKF